MDERQQQRINEAAQQFTGALVQSYRATADRAVSAQEPGAQLTQEFFNRVIENLRTQAEDQRQMTQRLADQQQRAQEAAQDLTRGSVGAYMDFLNSMFSFAQGSVEAAERSPEARSPETAIPESRAGAEELPIEDYDSLNVNQISQRLGELSVEEIEQLRDYETRNKNRRSLLQRFDARIQASSS
jgi:ABC-type transporter Mla subunit MlaD